jgi:hypothetical protein
VVWGWGWVGEVPDILGVGCLGFCPSVGGKWGSREEVWGGVGGVGWAEEAEFCLAWLT